MSPYPLSAVGFGLESGLFPLLQGFNPLGLIGLGVRRIPGRFRTNSSRSLNLGLLGQQPALLGEAVGISLARCGVSQRKLTRLVLSCIGLG